MIKLGINIDHVATLRQQRKETEPDVCEAARIALASGADSITVHLREDRRHIQDADVEALCEFVPRLNLEMSIAPEIVSIADRLRPKHICLVPEKREELTTEGGLDVVGMIDRITEVVQTLQSEDTEVSLFIDPDKAQLDAAKASGAQAIELHTGDYANYDQEPVKQMAELQRLHEAALYAHSLGLVVNAGHGLKYHNTDPIVALPHMNELNIGHSIICRSVFVGLSEAVKEMAVIVKAS
ncbi:pyridoxine 5'-phosphate synthase [bacterium]|jgi:pyridoxine 5-phosphate synthase|nr:pyridoxine 5'-phosphate synthase [bacterium]